ncbi:MAG: hypothetical protein JJ926_14450 [Roseitalea sp.]|jgi:hypothetical protein|uniref:Uncharacterized protein n=1 Tax=Oceaniradius stylonematis TaxID=2184161 RepID=A0A3A8AIR4_9HYPH|nr:hypothetical protein [Oceaniradius stylonematis]MBO6554417.1 hypothetical protein [Roseitalea sp.]MBO6953422.1 hypothetical protein [Rhizobiaceae bacterium]RNC96941.1 MAG: hypothetical protein ED558_03575 [Oricola sp.]MBO6593809.1 hypothetical protein [Roseitalea sp.]MBO6601166.1 hypothetical protein [Roseitalea sp.]
MRMTTLSVAAALFLAGATAASACNWSKQSVAQTPVDYSKVTKVEVAQAPVDAWLIKYLDAWEKA